MNYLFFAAAFFISATAFPVKHLTVINNGKMKAATAVENRWLPDDQCIVSTGGAIVDEERGVQHVFFHSGHPGGPAGVFRLTRTLDTPKLSKFLE